MKKNLIHLSLFLCCYCIPTHSIAQIISSANTNLSVTIPVVQVNADFYTAQLHHEPPNWRITTFERLQTPVEEISATLKNNILSLFCVDYLGFKFAATMNLLDTNSSELVFKSGNIVASPSCQQQDTAALLATLSAQLKNLSIEGFFEQSFLAIRERGMEEVIADGEFDYIHKDTVQLDDISDDFYFQTVAIKNLILEKLQEYDRNSLSKKEKLSYDVYTAYLQLELEETEYSNFAFPATFNFSGWPRRTEMFFTQIFTLSNKTQAEIYLALARQIGHRFTQIGELLETRKAAGIIEPFITLNYSQGLVSNIANTSATSSSYYQAFNSQISSLNNISDEEKQSLRNQLQSIIEQTVLPAYETLAQQMSNLLAEAPSKIGFGQFAGGEEFYNFVIRKFTSSNMTPDQVHNLGLQELERINAEMRALFNQLGYPQNESLAQLFARADSDGGTIPASEARAFYEYIIQQAYLELPNYFSVLPQQEVVVIEDSSGGGYYIAGSDDGTRPGAFYAYTGSDLPYTSMPSLTFHETVPGHHLQIALANEMDLPLFRRKIGFTSFVEGWALYAERLVKDIGGYEGDIFGDLGRLQYEAMRAARLVLDTGIHAKGWTYSEAEQFHLDNVGYYGSIARYSVWPGQATAYMTGMLKILELRERAQNQLGDLYDIKDFHAEVIGNGSMTMSILEQVIDNYINDKLSATSQ